PPALLARLPSFPTRRSSDLDLGAAAVDLGEPPVHLLDDLEVGPRLAWDSDEVGCHAERLQVTLDGGGLVLAGQPERSDRGADARDRKSTRLNSSHQIISYAV